MPSVLSKTAFLHGAYVPCERVGEQENGKHPNRHLLCDQVHMFCRLSARARKPLHDERRDERTERLIHSLIMFSFFLLLQVFLMICSKMEASRTCDHEGREQETS